MYEALDEDRCAILLDELAVQLKLADIFLRHKCRWSPLGEKEPIGVVRMSDTDTHEGVDDLMPQENPIGSDRIGSIRVSPG